MEPLKLRILNKFGSPDALRSPDDIEVHFPYENSESLVKRMAYGAVKIINDQRGEFSVELSAFEVQGLPIGSKQNVTVCIVNGNTKRIAVFQKCLNVKLENIQGQDRKVIYRES